MKNATPARPQPSRARPGFASRSAALRFTPDGKPLSLDESTRSIEFTAATEVPTLVWDYDRWDLVNEVLLMSGCRLPASGRCVFLDTHSRHSVSAVIGSFRDHALVQGATGQELKGRSYYSNTPDGEIPYIKTAEGHVTDVSVGYEINAAVYIEEGQTATVEGREFTGPLRVVTDWSLKELSLCPIGADEHAKVRQQSGLPGAVPPARPVKGAGREQAKEQLMTKRKKTKRQGGAKAARTKVLRLRAQLARAQEEEARAKLREQDEDESQDQDEDDKGGGNPASGGGQEDDERSDGLDKDEEREGDEDEEREGEEDEEREDDEKEERKRSRRSAVQRERDRIAEIRGICASFEVSAEQEARYVRKGTSADAVRKDVLAMLKAQRGGPAIAGGRGMAKSPIVADAERRAAKGAQR